MDFSMNNELNKEIIVALGNNIVIYYIIIIFLKTSIVFIANGVYRVSHILVDTYTFMMLLQYIMLQTTILKLLSNINSILSIII